MANILLTISLCFCFTLSFGQQPLQIGKVVNEQFVVTADSSALRKAMNQTLHDGTQISSIWIESVNQWHYLIGTGQQRNYSKLIAIELKYDANTRTFFLKDGLIHKTCASAGCANCEPFKEKGNIIGCHCKSEQSVSNECNFKTEHNSPFYKLLVRQMAMSNKKN